MRLLFLFIFSLVPQIFLAQSGILLNMVNGKPAIQHQVQAGETLYSISKKYNTTVNRIKQDNPLLLQNDLKINNTINIYYNKQMSVDISKANPNTSLPLLHTVKKGETLFGLAKRLYHIEVADLKLWNRLNSNEISIGQNLIVGWIVSNTGYAQSTGRQASQVPQTTKAVENSSDKKTKQAEEEGRIVYVSKGIQTGELTDLKGSKVYTSPKNPFVAKQKEATKPEATTTESSKIAVDKTDIAKNENIPQETSTENINEPATITEAPVMENDKRLARDIFSDYEKDTSGKFRLLQERGAAKWFKPDNGSLQLYALHKTAPVGTVLKIANPLNNYTVYVKVIKQLPATDENQNALLKISSNAMELLKIYDKVFMVDVSYYTPN